VFGSTSRTDLVRRAYAEGHVIGIHDTTHTGMTTLSAVELTSRMTMMKSLNEAAIGETPRYMRVLMAIITMTFCQCSLLRTYVIPHWTIDPRDWKDRDTAATLNKIDKFLDSVTTSSPESIDRVAP